LIPAQNKDFQVMNDFLVVSSMMMMTGGVRLSSI
jgi:hypothetical protein